jgi:hypothetical protein
LGKTLLHTTYGNGKQLSEERAEETHDINERGGEESRGEESRAEEIRGEKIREEKRREEKRKRSQVGIREQETIEAEL